MKYTRHFFSKLFLLISLFFLLTHCGLSSQSTKVRYPNKVSSEMQASFDQAEANFRRKNYDLAEQGYREYLNTYPYNRLSDQSQFRLGQLLMLKQAYSEAAQLFLELIEKTPDPANKSRAYVKAGICEYRQDNPRRALGYFDRVNGEYIRRHDKVKTGGLALVILEDMNVNLEKRAYYYALVADGYEGLSQATLEKQYRGEAPDKQVVFSQLNDWARTTTNLEFIDKRFQTYQGKYSAPYVDYKMGMAYYRAGDTKQARKHLSDLVENYSNLSLAVQARPILAEIGADRQKTKDSARYKVGVILPISGKYENFGLATLNGMECAIGNREGCVGINNVNLVTRDDAGDAEQAAKAVEELVNQEDVLAIVGPLSSASAMAAAKKAQELGVVLISLAQKEGIPQVGDLIFRFSLTPEQQIETLLDYATNERQFKNIAVFYPNSNYGKVFSAKFKSNAPEFGAEVTALHAYQNSQDVAEDLRQLKFTVSRTSPTNPIGFEAVFIPDSYNAILNIAPQLEAFGLDGMLLLGTNAWNDPQLGRRSEGLLENSAFLDIYFGDSKRLLVRDFVRQYQSAYGQTPSTLEAMGYDIIRYLSKMLARDDLSKRTQVRAALLGNRDYQGVTGLKAFGGDREAEVNPYLLTIDGSNVLEIKD